MHRTKPGTSCSSAAGIDSCLQRRGRRFHRPRSLVYSTVPGTHAALRIERITVDELYADLIQDYRIKGQTVEWAERVWNVHLKDFFCGMRAANLGTNQITGYVEKRLSENSAKSTVNRELALLRRAFSIGFDAEPRRLSGCRSSTST